VETKRDVRPAASQERASVLPLCSGHVLSLKISRKRRGKRVLRGRSLKFACIKVAYYREVKYFAGNRRNREKPMAVKTGGGCPGAVTFQRRYPKRGEGRSAKFACRPHSISES